MDADARRPAPVEIAPVVRSTAAELRVCARELQARVAMTVEDARKQRAETARLRLALPEWRGKGSPLRAEARDSSESGLADLRFRSGGFPCRFSTRPGSSQ
jgi:hypothetical protein